MATTISIGGNVEARIMFWNSGAGERQLVQGSWFIKVSFSQLLVVDGLKMTSQVGEEAVVWNEDEKKKHRVSVREMETSLSGQCMAFQLKIRCADAPWCFCAPPSAARNPWEQEEKLDYETYEVWVYTDILSPQGTVDGLTKSVERVTQDIRRRWEIVRDDK